MPPPLGLTITPDVVSAGDNITVKYTNQLSQTINVVFQANGKELDSYKSANSSCFCALPLRLVFNLRTKSMEVSVPRHGRP